MNHIKDISEVTIKKEETKVKNMDTQLRADLETLQIDERTENITVGFVTAKFKKLAKQRHPDKKGGSNVAFQDLQNAYKRIIKHIEKDQEDLEDYEK